MVSLAHSRLTPGVEPSRWPHPGLLGHAAALLHTWLERHRERQQLVALDARLLQDIGLTRSEALREGRKGFWQA